MILLTCSTILLATTSYGAAAAEAGETAKGVRSSFKSFHKSHWSEQINSANRSGMLGEHRMLYLDSNPSLVFQKPEVDRFRPRLKLATNKTPPSFFSETKQELPFPQGLARVFLYFHCVKEYIRTSQLTNSLGEYTDSYREEYTQSGPFRLEPDHEITLIHTGPEGEEKFPIKHLDSGEWTGLLELSPRSKLSLSLKVGVPGWTSSYVLSNVEALIVQETPVVKAELPSKEAD